MPPLKQPTSLEDKAMRVLVNFFHSFCMEYARDLDILECGIPFIKNETLVPPELAVKICNRLLWAFTTYCYSRRCGDHVLKITEKLVMDQTLIGYDIPPVILASLSKRDAARVGGVIRLRLNHLKLPYSLDTLGLENLTTFEKQRTCTDSDLAIVGKNCPMLKLVNVTNSRAVTDLGLAALTFCPHVEFLSLRGCWKVSASSVNHFLSVNKSIRHFSAAWPMGQGPGFDFRNVPNWEADLSVHESVESFAIPGDFTDQHLLHVVTKFPNLRSIKIEETRTNLDLSIIKSLRKLSKIWFRGSRGSNWAEFESLLEYFGSQIEWLEVEYYIMETPQQKLDSIFRLCKNVEVLKFDCKSDPHVPILVIPPFEKLKEIWLRSGYGTAVQFGKMSNLQSLRAEPCAVGVSELKSLIFNHTNFPNLKRIKLRRYWEPYSADELQDLRVLAKTRNLDLQLTL